MTCTPLTHDKQNATARRQPSLKLKQRPSMEASGLGHSSSIEEWKRARAFFQVGDRLQERALCVDAV